MSAASLVAFALALAGSAPALAHHPEITAAIDCDGRVRFTANAWPGFPDDPATAADERTPSRTNPEITISVSLNGGKTFMGLPGTPDYAFAPENDFTFSDTFKLPEPLPATVIVRAEAAKAWANAEAIGTPRQTPPVPVPSCDETGQDSQQDGGEEPAGSAAAGEQDGAPPGTPQGTPPGTPQGAEPGEPPAGTAQRPQQQDESALAAARVPATVREVGPAGFALGAAGLIALVAGLIAAGLWARRRVIESQ